MNLIFSIKIYITVWIVNHHFISSQILLENHWLILTNYIRLDNKLRTSIKLTCKWNLSDDLLIYFRNWPAFNYWYFFVFNIYRICSTLNICYWWWTLLIIFLGLLITSPKEPINHKWQKDDEHTQNYQWNKKNKHPNFIFWINILVAVKVIHF